MNASDIYAVIDLGSATMRGMVAYRNTDGRIVPVGYSERSSEHCIRKGCIVNIDESSMILQSIMVQLNSSLGDNVKIDKVYIGFGGRSLASTHYVIKRSFDGEGKIISKEDIQDLWREARSVSLEGKEILCINAPLFSINGIQEMHPQGILCRELEAKFQILACRPQHIRAINEMVSKAKLDLAGIVVSPMAEASVVLTNEERILGCCYVNIGAGCTSVSIYKNGLLSMLQIIPMGGINVTKDIQSLRLVSADADLIKMQKASIQTDGIKDKKIRIKSPDRQAEREISLLEVNRLSAARMREITANFINIISLSGLQEELGAGIVIGGGGAKLELYIDQLTEQLEDVRVSDLRPEIVDWQGQQIAYTDSLITTIGLLHEAKVSCAGPAQQLNNLFAEEEQDFISAATQTNTPDPAQIKLAKPSTTPTTRTIIEDADEDPRSSGELNEKKKLAKEKSATGLGKRLASLWKSTTDLFSGDEEPSDGEELDDDKR